ncbi:hypothetical protein [Gemmatimonas sp.]|uniref:hypothetical protein n=1 Tax=Gemmatimonas sp. TaxID=1962908 RepID=UPI003562675A
MQTPRDPRHLDPIEVGNLPPGWGVACVCARGTQVTDKRTRGWSSGTQGDPADLHGVDFTDFVPAAPLWWASAACRGMPPELFFTDSPSREKRSVAGLRLLPGAR